MAIDRTDPLADSLELQELSSALRDSGNSVAQTGAAQSSAAPTDLAVRSPSFLARAGTGLGNTLANGLLFSLGSVVGSQATMRIDAQRRPHPMPYPMAPLLDHPLRLSYRSPADTLGLFGFAAGMHVLDLGCGTGTFTEEMARMVGPEGVVHAVDIQAQMLDQARARLLEKGYQDRCTLHHAGAYALPLENLSIDLAVVIATLGEIPDRLHALLELYRVLKPGGRLAVGEEIAHAAYVGPRTVRALAEEAGFAFAGKTGNPIAFNMVFTRP